ncbi:MAG: PH domain-containing protein [Euryarchaeota archaeon]|nr:PH domain-containing protein [Euryarchaeota archaeon]
MDVAFLRLVFWELDRINRVHYLTTERLVLRGGVGNRRERTVQLRRIQEVRSEYGFLGQGLDYGTLTLVMNRIVRGKEAQVFEEREVLPGIGRLTEVKHHVEQLVEETKMPQKDRRRRVDERRVKESMRVLARWMRRGQRGRP